MDFKRFWGQNVGRLVPPCKLLKTLVRPVSAGLDPLYTKIPDSGGPGLEAWMLDAGRIGGIGGWWLLDGRRGLEGLPTRSR